MKGKKIEMKRNNESIRLPTLSAVLHVDILSKLVQGLRYSSLCANAHEKRTLLGLKDKKECTRNLRYQQRLAKVQISRTACKALQCKCDGD